MGKASMDVSNWWSGWRTDLDGWIVRARRPSDPIKLPSHIGFTEESSIAVRTPTQAFLIDHALLIDHVTPT